jgi:hypothetical protein
LATDKLADLIHIRILFSVISNIKHSHTIIRNSK